MVNKIILIGNLTRDPELRYTPSGTAIGNFRIACTTRRKDKEQTLFIDVITFGKQAEVITSHLMKGSKIYVEGELRERTWESRGEKRSKMEIAANNVRFLSGIKKSNEEADNTNKDEEASDIEPF